MTNRSNEMHITSFSGLTISSSGTAETSLIPFDSSGKIPRFIRVAATAQGTMRVSANGESATADDNPIQPGDSAVVATGGCRYISFLCTSGKLNVSALESGGWNTQSQEEYLSGLMTSLMTDGTQGWWYEPSDFSTLFQDVAGTIPVTAVEQSVALMLDKSGRGNHATQATSTSRPILRNRYNLLTKTEQFDDAVWTKTNLLPITPDAAQAPNGTLTADRITPDTTNGVHAISSASVLSQLSDRHSVYVQADGYSKVALKESGTTGYYAAFDLATGTVLASTAGTTPAIDLVPGTSIYRISYTVTNATAAGQILRLYVLPPSYTSGDPNSFGIFVGNGTSGIYAWGADLRPAADSSLPYQRVNTATDYDSDTSKFPLYLDADGSDDGMATPAFAAGSDKLTVFAAVHKRSDAAVGIVYELSASVSANAGSFDLLASSAAAPDGFSLQSRGAGGTGVASVTGFSAPRTAVVTGRCDIAADVAAIRCNGGTWVTSGVDQGTGNFGTYPLYLFRRAGTSLPFNGRFYGGAGKFRTLSAAEIATVEQYLRMKSRAY